MRRRRRRRGGVGGGVAAAGGCVGAAPEPCASARARGAATSRRAPATSRAAEMCRRRRATQPRTARRRAGRALGGSSRIPVIPTSRAALGPRVPARGSLLPFFQPASMASARVPVGVGVLCWRERGAALEALVGLRCGRHGGGMWALPGACLPAAACARACGGDRRGARRWPAWRAAFCPRRLAGRWRELCAVRRAGGGRGDWAALRGVCGGGVVRAPEQQPHGCRRRRVAHGLRVRGGAGAALRAATARHGAGQVCRVALGGVAGGRAGAAVPLARAPRE